MVAGKQRSRGNHHLWYLANIPGIDESIITNSVQTRIHVYKDKIMIK